MENQKQLKELKKEVKAVAEKKEDITDIKIENFHKKLENLESLYKDYLDKFITSELLDLKMLILEIEDEYKNKKN